MNDDIEHSKIRAGRLRRMKIRAIARLAAVLGSKLTLNGLS